MTPHSLALADIQGMASRLGAMNVAKGWKLLSAYHLLNCLVTG